MRSISAPITREEHAIVTQDDRLSMLIATVLASLFAIGTGALMLSIFTGGDPTTGEAELVVFLGAPATLIGGGYALAAWLRLRRDQHAMTTTWAIGTICLSKRTDYMSRSWRTIYSISTGGDTFEIGEDDYEAIRERSGLHSDKQTENCFEGAVQYVGGTVLRVEGPPGNLIYHDSRLQAPPSPDATTARA